MAGDIALRGDLLIFGHALYIPMLAEKIVQEYFPDAPGKDVLRSTNLGEVRAQRSGPAASAREWTRLEWLGNDSNRL